LRVVAAALIGQPRVVERLRQMVSSCRLLLLGGSQKGLRHALARLVVPARRLVLLHECVERAVEALLCLLGNQIAAAVLLAGGLPWLELLSATATGHGPKHEGNRCKSTERLHLILLRSRSALRPLVPCTTDHPSARTSAASPRGSLLGRLLLLLVGNDWS